jgi:N-acetylneuraminic acid mutarotase
MRRGLLASCLLVLWSTAAIAVTPALPVQASAEPGSWSKAAGLITGREEHSATLLPNGNVLIAGGTDGRGKVLASAEVYNPARNRWSPAASMATARFDHTATLLPSGKVLVAGGLVGPDPFGSLTTTELYDPTTDSWSATAPMIVSRARHTATVLPDGRVLVVGGLTLALRDGGLFPSQPTDAEIYDPQANRWSATAPMGFYRLDHTATRLADGRVLVAGGQGNGATVNSTEIYDETTNRWISAAPMGVRRSAQAATLLPDGDVLVVGGTGEAPNSLAISLTSAEIYDPRTNLWVTIASMAGVHVEHTATLLVNKTVLVVGLSGGSRPEVYDLVRNTWSTAGPSMDRYQHTATRLPNGKALIVGGYGLESLDSVLLYDPNAVAPAPRQPADPRLIGAVPLTALLLLIGIALATPAVRQRLRRWRPRGEPDEWIG